LAQTQTAPAGPTPAPSIAPNSSAPPPTYSTPAPTYSTPAPTYSTPAPTNSAPAPSYSSPPPATAYPPSGGSPAYASPPATFQGGVAPAPAWDPYVDPSTVPGGSPYYPQPGNAVAPPALFPGGGPSVPQPGGYAYTRPNGTLGSWPRLFEEIRGEYTYLAPLSDKPRALGINSVAASTTMNFPFFYNQAPLLITPGGAIHWLDGPHSFGSAPADLPPRLYDLYLDAAWKPVITPWLSADLGVRVGIYTDYRHVTGNSIRVMGRGLGILTFSPSLRVALGVVYLDRVKVKILPAGGVIWTPDEDTRYEILFPNPKLARRLLTLGTTEWWWYVSGEYGLGSWTIERADGRGDQVDINDLRAIVGLEWHALSGTRGIFEIGYVFDRKLTYRSGSPHDFKLTDTIMLRAGVAY
jgi:hypothetical protein